MDHAHRSHGTVVSLDVATKTGFAVFEDGVLTKYGTVLADRSAKDFGDYPFNYVTFAEYVADQIMDQVKTDLVGAEVVIEDTNPGRNALSQRILEFIHFALLKRLEGKPVHYIRTGVWRSVVGARQTAEEKKMNQRLAKIRCQTKSRVAKIDGKVVGRITRKHSSIRAFKDHFGVDLKISQNDAAEAALLGLAFVRGAGTCDGTMYGTRKEKK